MPELRERLPSGHPARKTDDEAEALSIVESLTDDSYQCFALLEDGTVLDLRGRFPGCVEVGGEEERDGYQD